MKDKLIDLATRWNTVNCNGMKPYECADELLEILDAEGDGGAVGEPTGSYLAHITANQAQNLLDYFGGESTTYVLIRCKEGECAPDDGFDEETGKLSPAGLYVYDANCPEEGVIYLGEEDEESVPTENNPARSGVVSDEDVSVVAKMIADRIGNGMREKYEDVARKIVEHFAAIAQEKQS